MTTWPNRCSDCSVVSSLIAAASQISVRRAENIDGADVAEEYMDELGERADCSRAAIADFRAIC